MSGWADWRLRLRALLQRGQVEAELREELDFHQAMAARAGRGRGGVAMSDQVPEACRDARGLRWLQDGGRDLRFALRRLRRTPVFTTVALLTLTLGIGANTALFTLVETVLLRRLPVAHPEQLVILGNPNFTGITAGIDDHAVQSPTYQQYLQLRGQNRVFSGVLAAEAEELTLRANWGGTVDVAMPLIMVSANYFAVLGVQPALGRFFSPQDDTAAAAPEAVMSYGYWQQRFGGDPAIVGRTLRTRRAAFTVIGVAPKGFFGTIVGQNPALYLPITLQAQVWPGRDLLHDPPSIRRMEWLQVMARLRPGVGVAQAAADCALIFGRSVAAQAQAAPPGSLRASILTQTLPVVPASTGGSTLRDGFARPLWMLFALVGVVLLVVAVNLGGMLLAQAAAREREFATRLALGARRGRLVRQLLAESLLLAAAGGAGGWWLAQWGARALLAMVGEGNDLTAVPLHADAAMAAFTLAVCALVGIGFGLAPARRLARARLTPVAGAGLRSRTAQALVVAQVALSIVLVTGAALFLRSLAQLREVPLGYSPRGLVTFNLNAVSAGATGAEAVAIYQRTAEAMTHLPGVQAVSFSENGLFAGRDSGDGVEVEGYSGAAAANFDKVAPGYFSTLGVRLLRGREFTPADSSRTPKPIVIDAAFARQYFAGRNPLGQHVTVVFSDGSIQTEVVGVAAVAKQQSPRDDPRSPRFYLDIFNGRTLADISAVNFEIRARQPALITTTAVNAVLAPAAGRSLRINSLSTVQGLLDGVLAPDLLMVKLTSFFGLLGLGLAAMGLYAMLSYALARRRSELGIRMALGARGGRVVAMVLREAAVLLAWGIALGIAGSLVVGRGFASLLYALTPSDPASLAGAALLLLAAGLLAALAPALRASRTDPARTLRAE